MPADRLVKPASHNITYQQAAGMMLKGMTVEYLMHRTFKVQKGMNVLIQAAAGGVGLIACAVGELLGRHCDRHRRLGGQGGAAAKANGCHHTITRQFREEDFPDEGRRVYRCGSCAEVVV